MKLVGAERMREIDRRAIEELGIPGIVLMENAGRSAAQMLEREYAALFPGPLLVLCGKGNNGGDGYVLARSLRDRGWNVRVLALARRDEIGGDAALHWDILAASSAPPEFIPSKEVLAEEFKSESFCLLVDALLGTGSKGAPRGLLAEAIKLLNAHPAPVLSLDIPSGVDSDTGAVEGEAVRAELTGTFALAKIGLANSPGHEFAGRIELLDIGLPTLLTAGPGEATLVDEAIASTLLPARPSCGHKGTFGHLLVLAGAPGTPGAAALCSAAGLRGGAGLVTLASDPHTASCVHASFVEVMTTLLPEASAPEVERTEALKHILLGKRALVAGPGMGVSTQAQEMLRSVLLHSPLPMVLDADALNLLCAHTDLLELLPPQRCVLTPHPGEMARLLGMDVAQVQGRRLELAREFAIRHRSVVVLKGARTVIASPDGRLYINSSGNVGMATAGSGDVLSGLIGALLCQGLSPLRSAVLGVFVHGLAGDLVAGSQGEAGMMAGDLLSQLPAARLKLSTREDSRC